MSTQANPHGQHLQIAKTLEEIKSAGLASKAFAALGLGDGSAASVSVRLPYPAASAPLGWLKCNGDAFSSAAYPQLAKVYQSLVLSDLRAEFIRGWDDGGREDNSRTLLSLQAHALQHYTHGAMTDSVWTPLDNTNTLQNNGDSAIGNGTTVGQWASRCNAPGGNNAAETRPRNVAFNYIVRAA